MEGPSRARVRLLAGLLFGLTLVLYLPAAGHPFLEYDDPEYVRANPHLAGGLSLACVRWALTSTAYQYNWHPLTWLSHALDVQLFGLEPGPMHAVNVLLHALNATLLFLALRALTARVGPSALVAALFALHPMRVESVAWIAQRKDLLAGTFFALTLLAWARHVRAPSPARYALVALALAAGLLCKPTLVTLPALLLVLDVWPLGRLAPRGSGASAFLAPGPKSAAALLLEKLPLLALAAGAALVTWLAQSAGGAVRVAIPLSARLANASLAYLDYIARFLAPRDLAVLYPHPHLIEPERSRLFPALGAAALLALALALAWRARRRWPWILVGALWFLGLLVPMIGLVQVGNQAHADRYAYLAQIGLELALAWSAAALWEARAALRTPLALLGALALAALGWSTSRQLARWRDSETLFTHTLAVTERNFVIENNLGLVLGNAGRLDEALAHFQASAEARPGYFEAELNLGKARHRRGEFALARAAFERATRAEPRSGEAHLCLAATLARAGETARAAEELARALECEPGLRTDARVQVLARELARQRG